MSALHFYESQIKMPGGSLLGVRSTLVTLNSGESVLISPIRFNDQQIQQIKSKNVKYIVAPNAFHHLFVKKTAEQLNKPRLYCSPALQKKRADIEWTASLDESAWPFQNELQLLMIEGSPRVNEAVFYHPESKTLIVTDLFFNLKNLENSFTNIVFKLMGTFNKPAVSRLQNILVKDKTKFKQSLARLLDLNFENLVMAHGENITGDAKNIFKAALNERGLV